MFDLEDILTDPGAFRQTLAAGEPYQPRYVKIKLTRRCNLRCVMCNVWRQRKKSLLTLPVMESLADELLPGHHHAMSEPRSFVQEMQERVVARAEPRVELDGAMRDAEQVRPCSVVA